MIALGSWAERLELHRQRVTGAPRLICGDRMLYDTVSGFLISESLSEIQNGRRVSSRFVDGTKERLPSFEAGWRTGHFYG